MTEASQRDLHGREGQDADSHWYICHKDILPKVQDKGSRTGEGHQLVARAKAPPHIMCLMTAGAENFCDVCSPTPISDFTPQVQNILLDGLGELSLARVGMRHCLGPNVREWEWQIDYIALLDVARVKKRGQDWEEGHCIL